jgi:hypothetical protein
MCYLPETARRQVLSVKQLKQIKMADSERAI